MFNGFNNMIKVIKYFRRSYFFGSTTHKTFCGEKWRQIQPIHNCFKFWSSRHCCNKLYTSLQILDIIWQLKIQFYKIESMLHIFWCATNFPIFSIIKKCKCLLYLTVSEGQCWLGSVSQGLPGAGWAPYKMTHTNSCSQISPFLSQCFLKVQGFVTWTPPKDSS